MPAMTASASTRKTWTSRRASGLVIHLLLPSGAALSPSIVAAYFQVTNGRPVVTACVHSTFSASAASASTPASTSMPAFLRASAPPAAAESGSVCP